MTNAEKYRSADERARAFDEYCNSRICNDCKAWNNDDSGNCRFSWLDLEAEKDDILPCPFCGSTTCVERYKTTLGDYAYKVVCNECNAESRARRTRDDAIAVHNRVARAVMEAYQ